MRSRTGCLTCRARKLKCDETRPACNNCTKGGRECIPSPGVVFRHQQNASMNAGHGHDLSNFYGYRESFAQDSVWVDIPADLTFINITDPYSDPHGEQAAAADRQDQSGTRTRHDNLSWQPPLAQTSGFDTYGLEALSAVAASGVHSLHARDRINAARLHDAPSTTYPASLDPRLQSTEHTSVQTRLAGLGEQDREIAFLLSHFATGPGRWMDLFNPCRFFELSLPDKIATYPLLLYSAAALSAKVLGRVGNAVRQNMTGALRYSSIQWSNKARSFYDQAIHLLRETLEGKSRPATAHPSMTLIDNHEARWRSSVARTDMTETEELVTTTAILCVYEFLDASGSEWSRHLDGVKSLLDVAQEELTTESTKSAVPSLGAPEGSKARAQWSPIRSAVFWNFATQDMLNAYIRDTTTRPSTDDIELWRAAGLRIGDSGRLFLAGGADDLMPDHMMCDALIWLMMKIINLNCTAAVRDERPHGVDKARKLVQHQLQEWERSLPQTFRPTAQEAIERGGARINKTWYGGPMQASTMQWCHFAHLQLLFSQAEPSWQGAASGSAEGPNKLGRAATLQGVEHAKAIVGIGLAAEVHGVRVHSVQPLYAAGQMLGIVDSGMGTLYDEVKGLRAVVIELLQGIEHDTGWATDYRVEHLEQQWPRT